MYEKILDEELTADDIPKKNYLNLIGGIIRLAYFVYVISLTGLTLVPITSGFYKTTIGLGGITGFLLIILFWTNHLIQGFRCVLNKDLKYNKVLTSLSFTGSLLMIVYVIYNFVMSYPPRLTVFYLLLRYTLFTVLAGIPFFLDIKLLFFKKKQF